MEKIEKIEVQSEIKPQIEEKGSVIDLKDKVELKVSTKAEVKSQV